MGRFTIMLATYLIVDGNNLIHAVPGLTGGRVHTDFDAARRRLARRLDELAGSIARQVILVYDGTVGGRDEAFRGRLEVLFTTADETADAVIERRVAASRRPEEILVVTSDRVLRGMVGACGARTMACREFAEVLDESRTDLAQRVELHRRRSPIGSLGDHFPEPGVSGRQ